MSRITARSAVQRRRPGRRHRGVRNGVPSHDQHGPSRRGGRPRTSPPPSPGLRAAAAGPRAARGLLRRARGGPAAALDHGPGPHPRQLRRGVRVQHLPARLRQHLPGGGPRHRRDAAPRLPGRLVPGGGAAPLGGAALRRRDPVHVDEPAHAHLRLDGAAAAHRHHQQGADGHGPDLRAPAAHQQPRRRHGRHDLHHAALHGAAAAGHDAQPRPQRPARGVAVRRQPAPGLRAASSCRSSPPASAPAC